jgi:hypothetical protein
MACYCDYKRYAYCPFENVSPIPSPISESVKREVQKVEMSSDKVVTNGPSYFHNPFDSAHIKGMSFDVLADGASQAILGSYSIKKSAEFIFAEGIYELIVRGMIENLNTKVVKGAWSGDHIDDDVETAIARFVTWSLTEYVEGKIFGGDRSMSGILKRNALTAGISLFGRKALPSVLGA